MTGKIKDIEVLKGKANPHILLIAPHAPIIGKKSMNDRNTGIITRQIQKALKCSAIINGIYRKPKNGKPDLKNKLLDFNIIEHAKLHPTFLDDIKKVVDSDCKTLVVWIHGMADSSAKYESKLKSSGFNGDPDVLDALIGYGQGPNPNLEPDKRKGKDRESRPTANKETVEKFRDLLIKKGLTTNLTRENAPNFRGRDPKRMNQWFRNEGYKLTHVESIQLEIREKDFRDNPKNCRKAAKIISQALSALIRPQEQDTKLPNEKQKQRTEAKAIVVAEKVKPNVDESNRVETSDDSQLAGGRPYQVKMRKIAELRPHPLNREIYGDPNPDDDLKNSIQKNGILTPLIISGDGRIVSGHRRFSGAKEFGIEEVPVIILPSCDDLDIEETLIVANTQRQKTNEQIAREYEKLKKIEAKKSKMRMSLAGGDRKSEEYKKSLAQNSAAPISKGDSRENAAARLGISHDTVEKALKVVNLADELKAEGKTEQTKKLLDTLNNKSVNSAIRYVKAFSEDPDILTQNAKPIFNKTNESIEWATWTWNPITGCKAGCKYCYARNMTKRFKEIFRNGFEPTFYPKRLEAPANTSVPKSNHIGDRNVFVVSMGDLFGDWVEQEWIDAVLDAVRKYIQWNYLFLTKNPKRLVNIQWPENAWVGTTVDCQARVKPAEEAFEKIKAKVKFLSCEPLSEKITFTNLKLFDWVIVGARSKTTEVPEMQPKSEWVKSLMHQAWDAGCKIYCKPNLKAGVKEYPLAEAVV